jgi:hypothetical protein
MTSIAKGSFTVDMNPLTEADAVVGVSLGRMSLGKRFEGDLAATGSGEMLTALTPVKGSAGYVALERVTGTLHGGAHGAGRQLQAQHRGGPASLRVRVFVAAVALRSVRITKYGQVTIPGHIRVAAGARPRRPMKPPEALHSQSR